MPLQTQRPFAPDSRFPNEFDPPGDDLYRGEVAAESDESSSNSMVKSTIGLAVGGVLVLIVIGLVFYAVRTVKRRLRQRNSSTAPAANVVTFVNELVSANVKTVSEEPLNQTLKYQPKPERKAEAKS